MNRKRRLIYNTFFSLAYQITTIICGFILPRCILKYFGSDINGLVNSILQFLQVIVFLELGVGAVVQSALYKPLAEHDAKGISEILASADRFFKKLATVLLLYVIVLLFVYPLIAHQEFDWLFTSVLLGAMSISSFAQYYFGLVDQLLLIADQRGYINYIAQTLTVIITTVFCVVSIRLGASIQFVKLSSSLIYIVRPICIRLYVNKKYHIDRRIKIENEPITQKWNGVAQHISAVVLDGTDTIVLTVFSSFTNVSIYSVYHLVVYGIKQLFISLTSGLGALFGELWAKKEKEKLTEVFSWTEWVIHTAAVFVFGSTGALILSFVAIYTREVVDAVYIQPYFAYLLVIANALHCLRLPYSIMILAGGHYKQTQIIYIVSAVLNVVVSIITVKNWGLIGVAIGTLVAMGYQTIRMAYYNSKNLIEWPFTKFIKQMIIDLVCFSSIILLSLSIRFSVDNYFEWVLMALITAVLGLGSSLIINLIFYRDKIIKLFGLLKGKFSGNH